MQLHLNEIGTIPATYPKVFYRVSHWRSDFRVADYSTRIEAEKASFASNTGERFDHKVSEMHIG